MNVFPHLGLNLSLIKQKVSLSKALLRPDHHYFMHTSVVVSSYVLYSLLWILCAAIAHDAWIAFMSRKINNSCLNPHMVLLQPCKAHVYKCESFIICYRNTGTLFGRGLLVKWCWKLHCIQKHLTSVCQWVQCHSPSHEPCFGGFVVWWHRFSHWNDWTLHVEVIEQQNDYYKTSWKTMSLLF